MAPCPRCGTPNEAGRAFCKFCGNRLGGAPTVTPVETGSRFAVDQRTAIGGGLAVVAVLAVAAFALFLSTRGGPAASPQASGSIPPASALVSPATSDGPSDSAGDSVAPTTATGSASASGTASPTSAPSSSAVGPSPTKVVIVPTEPVSIAFYAVRGGAADIYTVPPAGGKLTNVTGDDPADSDPKWSPNGQRLVFDSRRDDGHRNIWIREFDGTYNRVTNDANSNNAFPTWSPDGMKIAYVHDGEIWARDFAAGTLRQLTAGADDSRPSWSNKDVIAFHRTTPGNHEIFTVPADGSAPAKVLIAKGSGGGRQPSWSPDGTKLAYSKLVNGVLRIVVARANGTSGKTITPGSPCPCQFPTWSPAGNQIAFQAGPAGKEQIYVVGATGQNLAPGWGT
jgi:hypothetical protein